METLMMTISIVLPVYNGERYLASAIKSILQQTFDDFELIIVNDASLDRSLEIAKFFAQKDSRIKIICNEVNKKLPASLNIGFNKASGSYLTWTSHDNLLKPDCILRLKEELIQRNVDIVYANCEEIDENDNIQLVKRRDENIDELSHRNIIGACFLYKLAVHESLGGYNENLFLIEDYDFWARSYFEGFRFYHLNE